jgi:hypothetical protein
LLGKLTELWGLVYHVSNDIRLKLLLFVPQVGEVLRTHQQYVNVLPSAEPVILALEPAIVNADVENVARVVDGGDVRTSRVVFVAN